MSWRTRAAMSSLIACSAYVLKPASFTLAGTGLQPVPWSFCHSVQADAALVMAWSVIWKLNGTKRAGFSTISLHSSVIRSKHKGRRALRRHLGNSAYAAPRSGLKAGSEASNNALIERLRNRAAGLAQTGIIDGYADQALRTIGQGASQDRLKQFAAAPTGSGSGENTPRSNCGSGRR
jgi:hypothetical protein